MDFDILYFDLKHAIKTHDIVIEKTGGRPGIKDLGQLESVLEHIQNDLYYPKFEDKLTHLVFGICNFHTFTDGNKRSSLSLGMYFLNMNGFDYCIDRFVNELENIIVWVADNKISKNLLKEILYSIIYEFEQSEELKLKINSAIYNDNSSIDYNLYTASTIDSDYNL